MKEFEELIDDLKAFATERDWDQFHSPKNLTMAMTTEVGELVEHFKWLTEEQSANLSKEKLAEVAEELADIQIYLLMLSSKLGVDLLAQARSKIEKNKERYPAALVKGSPKKYNEY